MSASAQQNLRERRGEYLTSVGLLVGFLLGQGSLFAGQVILIANNKGAIVAEFGLAIATVTLINWIGEFGGNFVIARRKADELNACCNAAVRARAVVTFPLLIALTGIFALSNSMIARGCIAGGSVSLLLQLFNFAGAVDRMGKNLKVGPVQGLPWFLSSIALVFSSGAGGFLCGLAAALAYSAGIGILFLVQCRTINFVFEATRAAEVRSFFAESASTFGIGTIGNVYSRVVLYVCSVYLPTDGMAIIVLSRSMLSGIQQLVSFIRRVEFPRLSENTHLGVREAYRLQAGSLAFSVLASGIAITALIGYASLKEYSQTVAFLGATFCTLPLWAFASSFSQLAIARGKKRTNGLILATGAMLSLIIQIAIFQSAGIFAVIIAEALMFVLILAANSLLIKSEA